MDFLNDHANRHLLKLITHAKGLSELNHAMEKYLPGPLKDYCRVANYRSGLLILQTDSATWATQLKFHIPELLTKLRQEHAFHKLMNIKCIIEPPQKQKVSEEKSPTLSPHAASLLKETAAHIQDEKLAAALERLARS